MILKQYTVIFYVQYTCFYLSAGKWAILMPTESQFIQLLLGNSRMNGMTLTIWCN